MTTLDHSSPTSLLDDLNRYRGSVFRFKHRDGMSAKWRLKSAIPVASDGVHLDGVRLYIGYFGLQTLDGGRNGKSDGDITLTLVGGVCPVSGNYPMMVLVDEPAPSVDTCHRLDENLRGVFS